MNSKVYLTFLHSSNCEVNISVYAVNSGHGLVIVDDKYSFHFVGAHRKKKAEQLKNFREALSYYSHNEDLPEIDNWHDPRNMRRN